ncbi:MAG: 2-oxo acid dehydrogenase subunit E2 [Planctomycetes bacterium]|nr:2-oxo acid dehydrogenase subunit E2 [Planctomycetota bacterium]
MVFEFKLPDIGEGIAEGEIVKWLVKVGDAVREDQAVVEVMTDKATVEIPAPRAGRILELKAAEGATVPIGTVIFTLEEGAGAAAAPSAAPAAPKAEAPKQAAPAAKAPAAPAAPARDAVITPSAPAAPMKAAPVSASGKVLAVPSARAAARELGVDLQQVPGSGRHGLVRKQDVQAFAERGPAAPVAAPAASAPRSFAPVQIERTTSETRVPFRGVRKKIAEAMTRSKYTATHFTVVEEVDVTQLLALREKAKALGAEQGIKVTLTPFFMRAAASALQLYPQLNSMLDEAAQEIVTYGHVNLGIATDTPQGLIVPVVRDVPSKGLLQLSAELQDLAERTRGGKIKPEELKGSTFTITNAGAIGGILATPIINFPEVAIMGVHRVMDRPAIVDGELVERKFMNFSLSVDHRLVDGADGCRFLVHVKRLLEEPGLLAL